MKEKKVGYIKLITIGFFILLLSFGIFFLLYKEKLAFSIVLDDNDGLRTYVTYISSWVASSLTLSGLILGFFYYIEKKKDDYAENNEKCRAAKYAFLMSEIDYCDKIIEDFYHKRVQENDIKVLCDNLTKHCILINKYFEDNNISLLTTNNEPNPLSKWNSFINTAEIVRIRQLSDVDKIRADERSEYENKYGNVKIHLLNMQTI